MGRSPSFYDDFDCRTKQRRSNPTLPINRSKRQLPSMIFLVLFINQINALQIINDSPNSIEMHEDSKNITNGEKSQHLKDSEDEIQWLNDVSKSQKESELNRILDGSIDYQQTHLSSNLLLSDENDHDHDYQDNDQYDDHEPHSDHQTDYLLERNRLPNESSDNTPNEYLTMSYDEGRFETVTSTLTPTYITLPHDHFISDNFTSVIPKLSNEFYDQIPRPPPLLNGREGKQQWRWRAANHFHRRQAKERSDADLLPNRIIPQLDQKMYLSDVLDIVPAPRLQRDLNGIQIENLTLKEISSSNTLDTDQLNNGGEENIPTPFHFPYDGPVPEQFKEPPSKQTLDSSKSLPNQQLQLQQYPHQQQPQQQQQHYSNLRSMLNVLQKQQLNQGKGKRPQLPLFRRTRFKNRTMPIALEISGSFKNLQTSGMLKYLQEKYNGRQRYHRKTRLATWPLVVPTLAIARSIATRPVLNVIRSRSQPLVNDQFHSFKPRSPNEINNMLAMQHHQQKSPVHWSSTSIRNHNYKVKATPELNDNLFKLKHTNNNKGVPKRIPFNMNLDVYPVIRSTGIFNDMMAEDKQRITSIVGHSYAEEGNRSNPLKALLDNTQLTGLVGRKPKRYRSAAFMKSQKPPGQLPSTVAFVPISSNNNNSEASDQQQHIVPMQMLQKSLSPMTDVFQVPQRRPDVTVAQNDCEHSQPGVSLNTPVSSTKAIMFHLNFFPKAMKSPTVALRRQPLHNLMIGDDRQRSPNPDPSQFLRPFVTEALGNNSKKTSPINDQMNINREIQANLKSTTLNNEDTKTDRRQNHYTDTAAMADGNLEMLAAEARVASLFRFPVESLQQFQAHDAM